MNLRSFVSTSSLKAMASLYDSSVTEVRVELHFETINRIVIWIAAMNLADVKHLFNYTEWANELAITAASKLPDEGLRRDFGISHKSIFGTLLHMAGAEWIWLERWHGRSPAKAEAWPQWTTEICPDLNALRDRWREVVDHRWRYVSELDTAKLSTELPFRLLSGD